MLVRALTIVALAGFAPTPHVRHQTAVGPLAIIRRHDVPDSAFVQRGREFGSVAHLYLPTPKGAADGEGTLIAPRWVLTAAHVGREIRPGHRVTVGARQIAVDSIVIHPQWNDGGAHDVALLRLTMAATQEPAKLYRDSTERDRVVVLLGYGDFGTGETGPEGNDRQVRGATNRIDEATDLWLKFAFDPPGHPRTTPLEGVSGPGDSGGPAYLDDTRGEVLVGVSSGQSTRAARGPGHYGVVEYYVRVSRYISWIEGITGPLAH
jgi:hypothetical protein